MYIYFLLDTPIAYMYTKLPQAFWMLTDLDHLNMSGACCDQVYRGYSDNTMTCNIEKAGVAWERGYPVSLTTKNFMATALYTH